MSGTAPDTYPTLMVRDDVPVEHPQDPISTTPQANAVFFGGIRMRPAVGSRPEDPLFAGYRPHLSSPRFIPLRTHAVYRRNTLSAKDLPVLRNPATPPPVEHTVATTLLFAPSGMPVAPGPLDEALWYVRALGWPVVCRGVPTTDPAAVSVAPDEPVLLATGVRFDVLDVPGTAGVRALRRIRAAGLPLGPVAATAAGRIHFLVEPGTAEDLPGLLDWLDWSGLGLDLRAYGAGQTVAAPSPWPATWRAPWPRPWESARWLFAPGRAAPEPQDWPALTRLVGVLADACQQTRLRRTTPRAF
jgi:hypothetical protein